MIERGLHVDHTTIYRWVQHYAPELEKRCRPHLNATNDSWRIDETYVKVKKVWMYLYWTVDSQGKTLEFLLALKEIRKLLNASSRKHLLRLIPANLESSRWIKTPPILKLLRS